MKHRIIFETGLQPKPEPHEISAAIILADYYKSDVTFLRRGIGNTADFAIKNVIWELKSPLGDGKRTIANNLRSASRQSKNVVISLSRCKLSNTQAIARINNYLKTDNKKIKKILLISKTGEVIDIMKNIR